MVAKTGTRRGLLFFLLMLLMVSAGIAATVLLANDRRNLGLLLEATGWQPRSMKIPKPGVAEPLKNRVFKGKRLTGTEVLLPDNLFKPTVLNRESALLRTFLRDTGGLCKRLATEGFVMTPWQKGTYSKTIFECWSEQTIPNPAKPTEPSTFFLMVKGTEAGLFVSARVKFIISDPAASEKLAGQAASMLTALAAHTGWGELAERASDVQALKPFTTDYFGIGVKFSKEFSLGGGYNLIISTATQKQPQRRTEDFFERKNYFPLLPDHGGPPIPVIAG